MAGMKANTEMKMHLINTDKHGSYLFGVVGKQRLGFDGHHVVAHTDLHNCGDDCVTIENIFTARACWDRLIKRLNEKAVPFDVVSYDIEDSPMTDSDIEDVMREQRLECYI
jgi:hypothetical protein